MASTLAFTLVWYLGALALLWYVSNRYCEGMSLTQTAPFGAIAVLMLITASGIYYEYTDAPLFRTTYIVWVVVLIWTGVTHVRGSSQPDNH